LGIKYHARIWKRLDSNKLDTLEKYLHFYTDALKNQKFKLCYIDAFAGSGTIKIKNGDEIEGSAIRALKYPFDKYHFLEENPLVINELQTKLRRMTDYKDVEFHNTDCNAFLREIDKQTGSETSGEE